MICIVFPCARPFSMIEHNKNQDQKAPAWLAQSAERETLNLKVAGSTPASGYLFSHFLVMSLSLPSLGMKSISIFTHQLSVVQVILPERIPQRKT